MNGQLIAALVYISPPFSLSLRLIIYGGGL